MKNRDEFHMPDTNMLQFLSKHCRLISISVFLILSLFSSVWFMVDTDDIVVFPLLKIVNIWRNFESSVRTELVFGQVERDQRGANLRTSVLTHGV